MELAAYDSLGWPARRAVGGLALSVATTPQVNPAVSVLAYGMVVLSLVVQGGLLLLVADLLGLRGQADS